MFLRRWRVLILLAAALVASGIAMAYQRDIRATEARLSAASDVVVTGFGPVAHATGGAGAPVLAIHGAGGGHDQGRLLAEAFLPEGYGWVAPSRFGYPGAPMPDDASTPAQADAFAALLDALGHERVSVIAMSGGVPPALQLALRHPERVQGLILLSLAPYAPLTAGEQELPVPLWLYEALFASDFPIWAALRLAPRRLAPIFDARDELTGQMTAREAAFLDAMIAAFLPVTARREGLANEGAAIDPAAALDPGDIPAPALIVHARDDRITPVSTATFTAERMAEAELHLFGSGGHLLLGHHDAARRLIERFLAAHTEQAEP